jgi:hypothetical protein
VTIAALCQCLRAKNLLHSFLNKLASSDLYKISDQETRN